MTARELAERILTGIADGSIDPDSVVVRPFCICDDENGLVEALYVDEVVRRYTDRPEPPGLAEIEGVPIASRVFAKGNVEPGPGTQKTIKLF